MDRYRRIGLETPEGVVSVGILWPHEKEGDEILDILTTWYNNSIYAEGFINCLNNSREEKLKEIPQLKLKKFKDLQIFESETQLYDQAYIFSLKENSWRALY